MPGFTYRESTKEIGQDQFCSCLHSKLQQDRSMGCHLLSQAYSICCSVNWAFGTGNGIGFNSERGLWSQICDRTGWTSFKLTSLTN